MGKRPCCDIDGAELKKGPWTQEEDKKLSAYVQENGHGCWRALPQKAGLRRCGKSCRLRWNNYLRPDIKRGQFSTFEEQRIIQLHALLGNRWSVIAAHLPNRTDNEIKNYWNTHIKKRLTKMGIDPITHKKKHNSSSSNQDMMNLSVIDHITQWESTRLEAEGRLAKYPNLQSGPHKSAAENNDFMIRPSFDILKAWQSGYANSNGGGGQPAYTLSFLENAVSKLAVRESSKIAAGSSRHSHDIIKNCYNNLWSSQNESLVQEDNTGLASGNGIENGNVPTFNEEQWNQHDDEEENYWNQFCNRNPETLYSVVFKN